MLHIYFTNQDYVWRHGKWSLINDLRVDSLSADLLGYYITYGWLCMSNEILELCSVGAEQQDTAYPHGSRSVLRKPNLPNTMNLLRKYSMELGFSTYNGNNIGGFINLRYFALPCLYKSYSRFVRGHGYGAEKSRQFESSR